MDLSKYALGISLLVSCVGTANAEVKTTLGNGSFEDPVVGSQSFQQIPDANVPFWSTTDAHGTIEFWALGFGGVASAVGDQHIELNNTEAETISQSLCIAAGDQVSWSYQHRRRVTNPQGVNEVNLTIDGEDQGNHIGDDTWATVSGTYTAASTGMKAFVFDAINPAGGVGNFLDNIQVTSTSAFVEFSSPNYSSNELAGGDIPVLLIAGVITTATTVNVTVTGGTATNTFDFTNTVSVTIPVGVYDGTLATGININLTIADDNLFEPDETIDFSISSTGQGIYVGDVDVCGAAAQQATTYTILNDDAAQVPTLSEWALFVLMMLLAFVGYRHTKTRSGVRF